MNKTPSGKKDSGNVAQLEECLHGMKMRWAPPPAPRKQSTVTHSRNPGTGELEAGGLTFQLPLVTHQV